MNITYSSKGKAYSDFECEEVIKQGNDIITSSCILIYVARALIAKCELNHEEVVFYFEEEELGKCTAKGKLYNQPNGFADKFDDCLIALVGW